MDSWKLLRNASRALLRRYAIAGASVAALFLSGCGASVPTLDSNLPSVGEVGIETTVENFFGYLEDGDASAAFRMSDLAESGEFSEAPLLSGEVYASAGSRPELVEMGEIQIADDRARLDLRYKMGSSEFDAELSLLWIDEAAAAPAPAHYVVELPTSEFELSANGLEAIPDGSTFYIANVDVTAALRGAIADEDASRVPAFGGVYSIHVVLPGDVEPSRVIMSEPTSFYGAELVGG